MLLSCSYFYILKAQEKRDVNQENVEKNYQNIIKKLTEKFNIVEDVKKDVSATQSFSNLKTGALTDNVMTFLTVEDKKASISI